MTLECGAPFAIPAGVLTVRGEFPAAASARAQLVAGTVTVAVTSGSASGVVTPYADAFLVRDDRIVTLPLPQDSVGRPLQLVEGTVDQLPATVSLVPCAGGVLAPGSYEIFARVVLNHDDGTHTDSFGGPWPLDVL